MKNKTRWLIAGLVAVNAVLGVAAWQALAPTSSAFAQGRKGSDYLILSHRMQQYFVVYALDTGSGNLVALKQGLSHRELQPIARKDIQTDLGRSGR